MLDLSFPDTKVFPDDSIGDLRYNLLLRTARHILPYLNFNHCCSTFVKKQAHHQNFKTFFFTTAHV